MGFFHPTAGPGNGMFPSQYIVKATNRTGNSTALGEVVMFDLGQDAAETDDSVPGSTDSTAGDDTSGYNNFIDPAITASDKRYYIFGVAMGVIANDAVGDVLIRGRVKAHCASATAAGKALVANADGELDIAAGTGDSKVLAIAEEAAVALLAMVLFDGVHGFGMDIVSG